MQKTADIFNSTAPNPVPETLVDKNPYTKGLIDQLGGSANPNMDTSNPFALGKLKADNSLGHKAGLAANAVAKGLGEFADSAVGLLAPYADPGRMQDAFVSQFADPSLNPEDAAFADRNPILFYDKAGKATHNITKAMGLPEPVTDGEKIVDNAISTGIQFAVPVGGELKASRVTADLIAGGAAGAAGEIAKQQGGNEGLTTLVTGLTGLVVTHSIATKFGPEAAKIVTDIPPEKVFTQEGHLTEEGQHLASKVGGEENLKAAYEDAASATARLAEHETAIKTHIEEGLAKGIAENDPSIIAARKVLSDIDEVKSRLNKPKPVEDYEEFLPTSDARTAEQRIAEAASKDVPLTGGEANKNYADLTTEAGLIKQADMIGDQARAFKDKQQLAASESTTDLAKIIDDEGQAISHEDAATRGAVIKEAIQNLKEGDLTSVRKIYNDLSKIKNAPLVSTNALKEAMKDAISDAKTPEPIRKALVQEGAKYGFWGKISETPGELGSYRVDIEGEPSFPLREAPKKLNLANADQMRQNLNKMYRQGEHNPQLGIIKHLDDAVRERIEQVSHQNNKAGRLAQTAKEEYAKFAQKWNDPVIKKILGDINPEKIPDLILGKGKDAVTNLKKLKVRLLASGNTAGWNAIRAHAISNIIDKSFTNKAGEIVLAPRGYTEALKQIGEEKLKLLFSPSEFNDLMKQRRILNDTIAGEQGLVSSVKQSNHLLQMLYHTAKFSLLPIGHGATHIASLVMFGAGGRIAEIQAAKKAEEALQKMTNAIPESAKEAVNVSSPIITADELSNITNYLKSPKFLTNAIKGSIIATSNKDKQ